MRAGIVIARYITGNGKGGYSEYKAVNENMVLNFADLVERGFIKECKTKSEAEAHLKSIGIDRELKDVWEKEEQVKTQRAKKD
jgi:hypothetical protein